MKLNWTVAVAAIMITTTAGAQHVNVGIKAGVNLFNINNDNGVKYDPLTSFNAGLLGHIHLTRRLALQPEIVYSGQGAKATSGTIPTYIKLGYINVPVLAQYMFDNGFRLEAGPQLGFLVAAHSKVDKISVDVKDNYNTVDVGLGLGFRYVHPANGFGIDETYNIGLTDINRLAAVKSVNRGGQLGVFYLFNHK